MWNGYHPGEIGDRFAEIPRAEFTRAVVFPSPSGEVSRGAEAIWKLLALRNAAVGRCGSIAGFRQFATLSDAIYGYAATHQHRALVMTRFTFGSEIRPLSYRLTESLFVRLLGLIFLAASHSYGFNF